MLGNPSVQSRSRTCGRPSCCFMQGLCVILNDEKLRVMIGKPAVVHSASTHCDCGRHYLLEQFAVILISHFGNGAVEGCIRGEEWWSTSQDHPARHRHPFVRAFHCYHVWVATTRPCPAGRDRNCLASWEHGAPHHARTAGGSQLHQSEVFARHCCNWTDLPSIPFIRDLLAVEIKHMPSCVQSLPLGPHPSGRRHELHLCTEDDEARVGGSRITHGRPFVSSRHC